MADNVNTTSQKLYEPKETTGRKEFLKYKL